MLPLYSQELEQSDNPNRANPSSSTGITSRQDYGRIIGCNPKSSLTVCAPNDSRFVLLFTSILGDPENTYLINPGQTLTLSNLQRSFWAIRGVTYTSTPVRFNLIGRTHFELEYRNNLPTVLRDFYYPGRTSPYTLQFPYLAFLQQISMGLLGSWQPDWTVNIDVRTRLCHNATNAPISANCAGITGNENCSNIVGHLLVNRDASNPGTQCSGFCYWFDPPSRYYGQNYHRSWQSGVLSLDFNWSDTESTGRVQTPTSGCTVEGVRVSLTPHPLETFRLSATSYVFKGLILMRKRTFLDGSQSLDPLGFPELGENELVFKETNSGVSLQTAASAWFVASPPESFLLRIPEPDGSIVIISDVVDWYAYRLFWRSRIPFAFSGWGYGYDRLGGQSGNIFIWERANYSASYLPDYNPNSSTNQLGAQVMEMVFRPNYPNTNPTILVGRARFEVFFPATGYRHPPGGNSEPPGLRIPNWFYYYWRAMGSPAVIFTPNQGDLAGFYITGRPHVYVCDHRANYTTRRGPLFAIRAGQCPQNTPANVVTAVDTITVHGIHAFAWTVYHEFGHKWSYETVVQVGPNIWVRIWHPPSAFDSDGDNLADAWEARNGLCPYTEHTTNAEEYEPYRRQRIPSDPEVVADVFAYGSLLNADNTDRNRDGNPWNDATLWIHDWSDQGLQYGNPLERFTAFPWHYQSTGRNSPAASDLLRGWSL